MAAAAQAAQQNSPAVAHTTMSLGQGLNDPAAPDIQDEKLLRGLNAQRQRSMVADTDKLLRLTAQLNAEIARGTSATPNAEQLRRLAEIEKLARNVREKMALSVRPSPEIQIPFQAGHD